MINLIPEKNKRIHRVRLFLTGVLIFALCASILAGCGGKPSAEPAAGTHRLQIVTTIFPQYDFARHIAGEAADVHMLLNPGEEVHSYEPTPQDIRMIQNSDLFICVGGENDVWVDSILDSMPAAESGPRAVRLLDLVETYAEEDLPGMMPEKGGHDHDHGEDSEEEHDHDHEEDPDDNGEEDAGHDESLGSHGGEDHDHEEDPDGHDEEEHDHEHEDEPDEHVWTSPLNCALLIEALTEEICGLDPAHADIFRTNGEEYRDAFLQLDEEYREMISGAQRKTIIFGDRFPFRYLAEAYGLTCYAAFSGCSSDSEPSAATIAFLIDKAVEEEIPAVFKIEFSNGNIARAVSEAAEQKLHNGTAIEVLQLHSCHNLTRDEFSGGETCLSLMKTNLEALRAALGSPSG